MKVEKIDYVWAVLSFFLILTSFHFGWLFYGIVIVGLSLCGLMFLHIGSVRNRLQKMKSVYATITGYQYESGVVKHVYPTVRYTINEDGSSREINSVYFVAEMNERYEMGAVEQIFYDPDNPLFFFFADRENEMTSSYYKFMIFGAALAAASFIIAQIF